MPANRYLASELSHPNNEKIVKTSHAGLAEEYTSLPMDHICLRLRHLIMDSTAWIVIQSG